MLLILLISLVLCAYQASAVNLTVDLGYAKYRGTNEGNGIYRWAGMRYARSVSRIDGMRFAPPQDPLPERVGLTVNASEFGSICIGTNSALQNEFGGKSSEDCLFANVWAPAKATNESALPVYVFIQGGGFNSNGNANYDARKLIAAANNSMIVVNFNYRVGPYGFLASKEIVGDNNLALNNGLRDQRQLFKWVQKNIESFGGDPNHVTIGGASAGAGSVVLHLTAYGGRNDNLFHAAAAESPAFPPLRNVTSSQFMYDALLEQTGCKNLDCMRKMPAPEFQKAVRNVKTSFPGGKSPPIYFWNPTLDYDFIKDYTYKELRAGHFVDVPTIFGDDQNDGLVFTPKSTTSLQRAEQFVSDQFPSIDRDEWINMRKVWRGPPDAVKDTRWKNVAADIYGHIRYTCPSLNSSASWAREGDAPSWQYRWNVGSALHVSELGSIWNNGSSASSVFIQQYWVSFIKSFDPNTHKTNYYTSKETLTSPQWDTFGTGDGRRIVFSNQNEVGMEDVAPAERDKCALITGLGVQLEQVHGSAASAHLTSTLKYVLPLIAIVQLLCT